MLRFALFAILAANLAGCSDPAADAQRELEMVQRAGGNKVEVCAAKRKLADAYLKAHDDYEYNFAKVSADVACNSARLDRL